MTIRLYKFFAIMMILALSASSCKKYLDAKPQEVLATPTTLTDLQALLDNGLFNSSTPALAELVCDNMYVTTADWQSVASSGLSREAYNYIWDKETTSLLFNWQSPYQKLIYYSNLVLDYLPKVVAADSNSALPNALRGSALFYRAFAFHQLAQVYCKPYSSSASADMGIVLKLSSDINEPLKRSTVQQTYDQITTDLKTAADLLPETVLYPTRPNKAAVYGLLARVYLSMRDYTNAGIFSNNSLQLDSALMDFNTDPITRFNSETLYFNFPSVGTLLNAPRALIDSNLYNSYDSNDLRKTVYFLANTGAKAGTYSFRGSYQGIGKFPFDGIATDEIYLIRAECYARSGNKDAALADLNTLMIKRWSNNGTWVPFTATDDDEAKNIILTERRKELVFRCLRWSDIRRLNQEGANITLTRVVDGVTYTLPPNDLRSVLLIPQEEINLSGIPQNPR